MAMLDNATIRADAPCICNFPDDAALTHGLRCDTLIVVHATCVLSTASGMPFARDNMS